jgi:hypothetical protein
MAYYMGDYYRGDYYRGDPGVLGTLAKGVLKLGGGLLGGPVGAGLGTVISGILPGGGKPKGSAIGTITLGGKVIEPFSAFPGGRPLVRTPGRNGGGMSGYHLNKGRGRRGEPPGSYYVRNRSMNPANAKALRRAVRRQTSFVALARRVLRGTGMTIKRSGFGRAAKGRKR